MTRRSQFASTREQKNHWRRKMRDESKTLMNIEIIKKNWQYDGYLMLSSKQISVSCCYFKGYIANEDM
jgi:hypothetical protein